MIIFEFILTTFEVSIIFQVSWGSSGNWLDPKTEPPSRIKSVIRTVQGDWSENRQPERMVSVGKEVVGKG